MPDTYVMNLTHFLDEDGNIPTDIPRQARELGSFIALIVDKVTAEYSGTDSGINTGIRCRSKKCSGEIIGLLEESDEPVHWHCLECGHHGVTSEWQNSKWDNLKRII